jgi:membrane protease YdiL (CAAX protease family)
LGDFLYFEATHGALLFFWEFFFRGFILFGLAKKIGPTALPVHAIPFALFHMGKPSAEVIASFFAALLLGQIALKAKSFLPAFLIHWAIHAEMIFLANFA